MPKNSRTSAKSKRRSKPTKAQELQAEPLYNELGEIGRLSRPLNPANLTSRKALLECFAVERRATSRTTKAQLARFAAEAIEAAVTSMGTGTDREITDKAVAEAAFGLGPFSGDIEARQNRLKAEPPYISHNVYAKRRPFVFEQVMFALEDSLASPYSGDPTAPLQARDNVDRGGVDDAVALGFTDYARRAAALYYSGLMCLFAGEQFKPLEPNPHRNTAYEQCVQDVFLCFIEFLSAAPELYYRLSCTHWPERPGPLPPRPAEIFEAVLNDPWVIPYFPPGDRSQLVKLHETLIELFPFSPEQYDVVVKKVPLSSRLAFSGQFQAEWTAWATSWSRQPNEPIVAAAGKVEQILRRNIDYRSPVTTNAERRARKLLSVFYETDEWVPDASGVALKDRVNHYFAGKSAKLC